MIFHLSQLGKPKATLIVTNITMAYLSRHPSKWKLESLGSCGLQHVLFQKTALTKIMLVGSLTRHQVKV